MKYGYFDLGFRKFARRLTVVPALLLFASVGSAASLCVDGDTLAKYLAAGSCFVNAGIPGLDVLFTFDGPNAFKFIDSDGDVNVDLTPAGITVYGVTGQGRAGLKFEVQDGLFNAASEEFADLNLTFGVSVYANPAGYKYLFNGAHLILTGTPGSDPNAYIGAGESDQLNSAFDTLGIGVPADPGDTPDVTFSGRPALLPNTDLIAVMPGSQITSWVESYDLVNIPEPGSLALIPGGLILLGLLRKKNLAKSILPVLALLTLFAAKSHANALCTDLTAINGGSTGETSLTIEKYIAYTNNFGGCNMNDMLFKFTSFGTTGTTGTSPAVPTAANTQLIFSLTSPAAGTKDVQLQYNAIAVTSTTAQSLTVTFQYSVTAPTYRITKMIGSTTKTGVVGRTTAIVADTLPAPAGSPSTVLGPSITFSNPLNTTFSVTDTFTLTGVNKHMSSATDKFTEVVPEPLTSLLMGSALLGIGLLSRKLRQA